MKMLLHEKILRINKQFMLNLTLLIYSLLPAFAKLLEASYIYGLYIIILFLLYLLFRKNKLRVYRSDLPYLIICIYIFMYIPFSIYIHNGNYEIVLYGLLMSFIPMIGYFYSRLIDFENFVKAVVFVGVMHAIFGILTYDFLKYPEFISNIIYKIKEGVMAFRMSSVSGSLPFATLMIISVSFTINRIFLKRNIPIYLLLLFLFIFASIMSMQRSAWLAIAVIFIITIFYLFLRGKITIIISLITITIILVLIFLQLGDILWFIEYRANTIFSNSPVSERYEQWIWGIKNFINVPSGLGIGTSGQVNRILNFYSEFNPVYDGDYFRIISDLGILGLIFYIYLFFLMFLKILNLNKLDGYNFTLVTVLVGLSINMIGSNTTEFYFVNFLYWTCVGYFLDKKLIVRGNK
jgi:hypothetical protein